jgi:CRP-like cAMP-binding protein
MDRSLFERAPIFKGLDEDEMEAIAEICEVVEFRYGEYVFREGDEADRLYIIEQGAVRISRDVPGAGEEALTVMKRGACFGEMAVFDRSRRSTDAIAHGRCSLLTIGRADFEHLLENDRELAHKVLWSVVRLLCERLRSTNDSLRSIMVMAMF